MRKLMRHGMAPALLGVILLGLGCAVPLLARAQASTQMTYPQTGERSARAMQQEHAEEAQPAAPDSPPAPATPPARSSGGAHDYVLGSGDKIKVTVFGEPDLSGEFQVSATGEISLPLIGPVKATGVTISKLEDEIAAKLKEGYMKDPRVSIEVGDYRPFFIVGEVMKPGSYNYVNGMTVITAVALAGGYTYRADKDGITVKHGGANGAAAPAKEDSTVQPGDVINVSERFF